MEEYKKSVDAQHAPEALIEKTLQRIHEEERGAGMQADAVQNAGQGVAMQADVVQNAGQGTGMQAEKVQGVGMQTDAVQNAVMQQETGRGAGWSVQQSTENKAQPKKARRRYAWIGAAAGMAAAVALGVGVTSGNHGLTYNIVQESQIRGETEISIMPGNEMSVEAYGAYLGRDFGELPKDVTLRKADISVTYAEDGTTIIEDEGTFYYNVDSNQVMVKTSKTTEVAPQELLSGEASEWQKLTVYAGENESGDKRLAALRQGDVNYFVMSYGMSEKEFETFLKNFF